MTRLTESLAQSVASWGARLTYGEAISLGGQELVPVAVAGFGFGAGEGSGDLPADSGTTAGSGTPTPRSEGSGGGGGGFAVPVGAYVSGPDGIVFRPNPIALVVAAAPLVTALGVAVAQIVRASRVRCRH